MIFQDRRFLDKCWTHDLETLVKAADLEVSRGLDMTTNPVLYANWAIVKDWSEVARYQQSTELEARELYEAVTEAANGVLPWIRIHW